MEEETGTGVFAWYSPEEILNQLERLVASVHFRNSKRYPALLRYLVEQTLFGRTDCLKERTLGIEVFGRPADYDTNADPVVRISAGEVRKRIAQYYQAPDHGHELRLALPLGSYTMHFLPPLRHAHAAVSAAGDLTPELTPPTQPVSPPAEPMERSLPASPLLLEQREVAAAIDVTPSQVPRVHRAPNLRSRPVQVILACGILGVVAVCALTAARLVRAQRQEAGLAFFWGPLVGSKEPAMIVLGVHSFDIHGNDLSPVSYAQLPQGEQTALASMIRSNMVPVSDVVSYSEVVSLLTRQSLPFRTQSAAETTIEEFRRGPLILIGGFNNMWTMRLTSSLRFQFNVVSASLHEIRDSQHPEVRWQFDNAQSVLSNTRDYAIIARFFDLRIEQHVVVVAGIGKSGTEAAADFVTDKRTLQTWVEKVPVAPNDNVEMVLATDVIEGKHGPPHVVAAYRW